jgi:deoxyribonuclease-4
MSEKQTLLGFHASISGGVDNVPGRLQTLDCTVGQIFTSSNRRWAIRDLKDGEAEAFKDGCRNMNGTVIAHACYLINLAKEDQEAWEKSVDTLRQEIERADTLGVEKLVLHPGSHVGAGVERGIERIGEALNTVIEQTESADTKILLETMAGQGTSLGHRFDQLVAMRERVEWDSRIEYCLDTCHMHAAGYDFRSEDQYESVMQEVESSLGLDQITVIHLNDSKKECDSRVDRHENIGEGTIGEPAFRCFMNDPRWESVPKILETPVDDDWETDYGRNLELLRGMVE